MITSVTLGDRLQDSRELDIWEVIEIKYSVVFVTCIDPGKTNYSHGHVMETTIGYKGWQHLGNYGKSKNFSNLFDILDNG